MYLGEYYSCVEYIGILPAYRLVTHSVSSIRWRVATKGARWSAFENALTNALRFSRSYPYTRSRLRCDECGTRTCIAYYLGFLLDANHIWVGRSVGRSVARFFRLLRPSKDEQTEALWRAISDILWKIGERKKAVVALPQERSYVAHSIAYFQDSITEKVSVSLFRRLSLPLPFHNRRLVLYYYGLYVHVHVHDCIYTYTSILVRSPAYTYAYECSYVRYVRHTPSRTSCNSHDILRVRTAYEYM